MICIIFIDASSMLVSRRLLLCLLGDGLLLLPALLFSYLSAQLDFDPGTQLKQPLGLTVPGAALGSGECSRTFQITFLLSCILNILYPRVSPVGLGQTSGTCM